MKNTTTKTQCMRAYALRLFKNHSNSIFFFEKMTREFFHKFYQRFLQNKKKTEQRNVIFRDAMTIDFLKIHWSRKKKMLNPSYSTLFA